MPDFDFVVNPEWGDTSQKVETALEFIHTRVYYAFWHSSRVQSLSREEVAALSDVRLEAHSHLTADEHAELRAFERSLRDMSPDDEHFERLSAEWAHILLDAVDIKSLAASKDDDGGA